MFFIVDENNDLVRSHTRWGSPVIVTTQYPHDYAAKFNSLDAALSMLRAWEINNNFKGRVVNRDEAVKISVAYTEGH